MNLRSGVLFTALFFFLASPLAGSAQPNAFAGTYTLAVVGSTLILPLSQQGNHLHGRFISYVHSGSGKATKRLGAVVDGDTSGTSTASLTIGTYECKAELLKHSYAWPQKTTIQILHVQCDSPNAALQDFVLKRATEQEVQTLIRDAVHYAPLPNR